MRQRMGYLTTALPVRDKIRLQLLAKANNVSPSAYLRAIITDILAEEDNKGTEPREVRYFGEIPL